MDTFYSIECIVMNIKINKNLKNNLETVLKIRLKFLNKRKYKF